LNHARKIFLVTLLALACASTIRAQRFIANPSNGYGGYGWGGWGGYGWGGYTFGNSGLDGCCMHHPEEHPPFGVGFAHGDPEFIPSTFMDYDKALALGKKILEEQAKPQPSLGEIARQLRKQKKNYVPPPAPDPNVAPANEIRGLQGLKPISLQSAYVGAKAPTS